MFNVTGLNWDEAENYCLGENAHLASVHSEDENTFITNLVPNRFFLGGTDRITEGNWTWSDGSPFDYKNWKFSVDTPTDEDGNHDCMEVNNQNVVQWNDRNCTLNNPENWKFVLCKKVIL